MATENDISSCVARLFCIIREGQASDFTDLLDSDDFDYDTTAQAIQRVLEESKPEDWESACVWFFQRCGIESEASCRRDLMSNRPFDGSRTAGSRGPSGGCQG